MECRITELIAGINVGTCVKQQINNLKVAIFTGPVLRIVQVEMVGELNRITTTATTTAVAA